MVSMEAKSPGNGAPGPFQSLPNRKDTMRSQTLEGGFFATMLPSGYQVLGKSYGEPCTYPNRHQARRALQGFRATNPGFNGYVMVAAPFYVVIWSRSSRQAEAAQ
jgi:hypothetical protein